MKAIILATTAVLVGSMLAATPAAQATGRAACPGVEKDEVVGIKDVGIIPTKSTDMTGTVYANGATRCTIKFRNKHKTAPYCMVMGPELYSIIAKVLRTSPTEVTFTFDPPLNNDEGFVYQCMFRD